MDKGKPCFLQFSGQDVRDWCASMTKEQLDMAILGQIMANLNIEDTVGGRSSAEDTVGVLSPWQEDLQEDVHHAAWDYLQM